MEDNIFDKVHEVDMKKTMEEFYIDYAMSVIASRRHRQGPQGRGGRLHGREDREIHHRHHLRHARAGGVASSHHGWKQKLDDNF